MRARAWPGQLIAVNGTEDVDCWAGPAAVEDGDWDWPLVPHADIQQRHMDRSKGTWADPFSHETQRGPFCTSVPIRVVRRLVGGQRFLNRTLAPLGDFVRGLDDPALLLPPLLAAQ